jgi:D-alanyl-D-alanine carboxypeptidase
MKSASLAVLLPALFPGTTPYRPASVLQARGKPAVELRQVLQERLDTYVATGRVPGVSAGVVLPDGSALALAAGLADRERETALEPGDRLCGGSTGKTFVATVLLQLVQEGKLGLDDLLGEHLGDEEWFERLPNAADITIAHLLGHRTGIMRHEFDPAFMQAVMGEPDRVWKPAELVSYVLEREPPFAAGQGFAYSDTNFVLLGMVIEKLTGRSLYQEIQERLLTPLGLTGIRPQDARALPGLVQGYAGEPNPFGAPDRMLAQDGRFFLNPQFEWAGGGFIGNGGDYARWARALYGGKLLAPETLARMTAGESAPELGRGMRYGLGCENWPSPAGECVGHAGFFPGYLTEIRYWPGHRIAVAVQVNTSEYAALPQPLGALCEELLECARRAGSAAGD